MNKKLISTFAAVIACMFLFTTGCKTPGAVTPTTPTPFVATPAALNLMQVGAQIGTFVTIEKYPDATAYFQAAAIAIGTLVNDGTVNADSVIAAIDGIKVNEIHTPEARLAIAAALRFYQLQWGQAVAANLDAKTYCIPILTAFRAGILDGLDLVGSKAKLGLTTSP